MKNIIVFLIIITGLFSGDVFSQNKYKVLSIDSIVALKQYLIKVKKGNKVYTILSDYNLEKRPATEKGVSIFKGMKVQLVLKELDDKDKPFFELIENTRNGSNPIYVDGQKFDPKSQYYYSPCIKGLYFITNCK